MSKQRRKTIENIIPLWLSWGQTNKLTKNNVKASRHTSKQAKQLHPSKQAGNVKASKTHLAHFVIGTKFGQTLDTPPKFRQNFDNPPTFEQNLDKIWTTRQNSDKIWTARAKFW